MDLAGSLLLLDIDGVLALEVEPPLVERMELLRLHQDLAARLAGLGLPFVVLTHRSRREALHILDLIGLGDIGPRNVIAAEDLLVAACRAGQFGDLFRGGLRKSFILSTIARRYGVAPHAVAFVDDKRSNLRDLLGSGLGLAMLAPSSVDALTGRIGAFDFAEVVDHVAAWREGRLRQPLVELTGVGYAVEDWRRTGLNTAVQSRHWFNLARRLGRLIRLGPGRRG